VSDENLIAEILRAPLGSDWTVEQLADRLLSAIAASSPDAPIEYVLDADSVAVEPADCQVRRLVRPLLACLATTSAAESGVPAELFGGRLAFRRTGPDGPRWIIGHFENRQNRTSLCLRRSNSQPADDLYPSRDPDHTREALNRT
jgi:hypothetical protein